MTQILHVFIDTNVFLSFFAYTGDDIEQLKKLAGSIKHGALRLYVPRQVVDEFERNRERCIKESIDSLLGTTLPKSLPRLMLDYTASGRFADAIKNAEVARNDLLTAVRDHARDRSLAADKLFQALCEAAGVIDASAELVALARERRDLGKPPGKSDTIGDQLNWETLLAHVESGADLHIVSKDGDYRSMLFPNEPHTCLADEWRSRKCGELVVLPEIKPLLNAWFPAIKLKIDEEKGRAIEDLVNSSSFDWTHQAIENLLPFIELLTPAEVKKVAEAAWFNSQIRRIAEDPDVADLYRRILPSVLPELPNGLRSKLVRCFRFDEVDAKTSG